MIKNSSKTASSKVFWLFLSVISGILLLFQLLGLVLVSLTGISLIYSILSIYVLPLNLLLTILLYIVYIFARRRYFGLDSKTKKNKSDIKKGWLRNLLTRKDFAFILIIILITAFPYFRNQQNNTHKPLKLGSKKTLTQQWEDFKNETSKKTNYKSTPIYEANDYTGCFDKSGQPKGGFCQFNNNEYYVAEGDYRQYLRDILIHLKSNGYDFNEGREGRVRIGGRLEDYTDKYIDNSIKSGYLLVLMKNRNIDRSIVIASTSKDKLKNSIVPDPPPQSVTNNIGDDQVVYWVLYQQSLN